MFVKVTPPSGCSTRNHGPRQDTVAAPEVGQDHRLDQPARHAEPREGSSMSAPNRAGGTPGNRKNRTRELLFEPRELLEKLAALTPRPRVNLIALPLVRLLEPLAVSLPVRDVTQGLPPLLASPDVLGGIAEWHNAHHVQRGWHFQ